MEPIFGRFYPGLVPAERGKANKKNESEKSQKEKKRKNNKKRKTGARDNYMGRGGGSWGFRSRAFGK